MDFLDSIEEFNDKELGLGSTGLPNLVMNRYALKKKSILNCLSGNASDDLSKHYELIKTMVDDTRYHTKNLETYITVFNLTNELPDFMRPWIKNEYRRYSTIKQVNDTMQIGLNVRYAREIKNIIKNYDSEKTGIFECLTARAGVGTVLIDEEFFSDMEYILYSSELDVSTESKIYSVISEWHKSFEKLFKDTYSQIKV